MFVCVDIANISIRGKCLFETPFHLKFCEILHSRQHSEGFMAHDFVTDVSIKVYRSFRQTPVYMYWETEDESLD